MTTNSRAVRVISEGVNQGDFPPLPALPFWDARMGFEFQGDPSSPEALIISAYITACVWAKAWGWLDRQALIEKAELFGSIVRDCDFSSGFVAMIILSMEEDGQLLMNDLDQVMIEPALLAQVIDEEKNYIL